MFATWLCVFSTTAVAQNDAYLTAERYAARARLALVADDPRSAGRLYEQAHETLADPSYLIHAAEAYVSGGLWEEARRVYAEMLLSPKTAAERISAERGLTMCAAATDGSRALVSVYVFPENAGILLDSEPVALDPPDLWMSAGHHELQFQHPGYETKTLIVDAVAGRPTLVRVRLVANERQETTMTKSATRLKITANVTNADVLLDGRKVGTTPLDDMEVVAGLYEIRITKAGFVAWQRSVAVQGPFPTEVLARLEPVGGNEAPKVTTPATISPKEPETAMTDGQKTTSTDGPDPRVMATYQTIPKENLSSDLVTYGWTVFGIGAAAALTGGIFQILAVTAANEANDLSVSSSDSDPGAAVVYYNTVYVPEHNRLQEEADSRQTIAMALAIGGGVVAAAGLVTAIIGHTESPSNTRLSQTGDTPSPQSCKPDQTTFQIGPTDGGAAVSAQFRF
ncbi:MAG: PEGA domain-containing protein [Myxococcales bacterium]|nr:PEGA domain-containing protein [Myxococcales bacterium]